MNTFILAFIGMWETIAILAVVLVLFGAKKLPELAKGLGSGIKEFRKASREVNEDLQRAFDEEEHNPPPQRKLPAQPAGTVSNSTETKA
jgi:sec-independent protein translocase protein TatA